MRGRWAAIAALAAGACSSSNSTAPGANDAGNSVQDASIDLDGSAGDDGSGAGSDLCGAAPYVQLGITVTSAPIAGATEAPIAGARFTTPLCPGEAATSDAAGKITGHVSKGAVFYGRFDANKYASILTPEQTYASDDDAIGIQMLPSLFTAIIKGYDATKATIFVGAIADNGHDGGSDPCDALDGITIAIAGHPEWAPTYYSTDAIPAPVAGNATTASGRASFAAIDVGEPVTLIATKPGCDVTFVHGADTGRAPREAAYVSIIGAYVHDASGGSDAGAD